MKESYTIVATTKEGEKEVNDDHIRETECASCRFVCVNRPTEKTHGVNFICRQFSWCFHNRSNKFVHSHYFFESLGELGYHFFDVHRNVFYGFASILTLLSTALFLFGAAALSNQNEVISASNWAILTATDTKNKNQFIEMDLGLNAVLFHFCPVKTSDFSTCTDQLITYSSQACKSGGFLGDVCSACEASASSEATGAAFAAFTKFLALGNMQLRMYTVADSPSFKLFSIFIEIFSIISLLVSLGKFEYGCVKQLKIQMANKDNDYTKALEDVEIVLGTAFLAFSFGIIASGLRLILHILTPLPRRGKGILIPLYNIFTRCDGCCVLYDDDLEDQKRHAALGIKQNDDANNNAGGKDLNILPGGVVETMEITSIAVNSIN